jgi:alkanesulfonate monooxygenase SsuD/methylene tetrahydromethanopterin reductase-like flavin-dependent oxidoreductase (luciferase family)
VFIASSEFDEAARAQAVALGVTPRWVLVPHPIQDRTDEEMRALADGAVLQILNALTT